MVGLLQDNVSSEEKNPSSFATSLIRTIFLLLHYFLPAAKPTGYRTGRVAVAVVVVVVLVVVVVVVVVGGLL